MERKFGILGWPLGHTLSPPIHKRLFELSQTDGDYGVYEVAPEDLAGFAKDMRSFAGLNVTIPHKVSIIPFLDELDESAVTYNAVNFIVCGEKLRGYNTDCYGFEKTAEALGASLCDSVCVLGAGGVGRMFAVHSAMSGADVTMAVRDGDIDAAQTVKREIIALRPNARVRIADISALHTLGYDFNLLINATPVGMYPRVDAMPVQAELLPHCRFVFEAVYNPAETLLLKEAKKAGCKTTGGMAMLVWQAVKAHEILDGAVYNPQDIAKLIEEMTALLAAK